MKPEKQDFVEDAPDIIRDAVRQLEQAHKRSAEMVEEAVQDEGGEPPIELNASLESTLEAEGFDPAFADAVRRAEAVLFAAGEALSAQEIGTALPPGVDTASVLMALQSDYSARGVNLVEVGGKWRFQSATDLSFLFVEERPVQKKLSQPALETLAIIAYGQPVTRAEIEAVRGVAVSKGVIDTLIEANWIKIKGRRKTPGRPVTFGTTAAFLEHFGIESLEALPGKADLEAEGLLSNVIPDDFEGLPSEDEAELIDDDTMGKDTGDQEFMADFLDEDAQPE